MLRDGGVAVFPTFLAGPLAIVSDRALRTYLFLRAKAVRRRTELIVDGVTVVLLPGEVALSQRTLRTLVRGGPTQLSNALAELDRAGLIERNHVTRRALSPRRRERSQRDSVSACDSDTSERLHDSNAGRVLLTRFKLCDCGHLAAFERYRSGNKINTRAQRTTSSPVSQSDLRERHRVDALLAAEGR
jgi:hypothetical protein